MNLVRLSACEFAICSTQSKSYSLIRFIAKNDPETWFFQYGDDKQNGQGNLVPEPTVNVSTLNINAQNCSTSQSEPWSFSGIDCAVAQAISENKTIDPIVPAAGEGRSKTFHPKIAGFAATGQEIIQRLEYQLPGNGGRPHGRQLRIMALGDSLTVGLGSDGLGSTSYRRKLYELLTAGSNPNIVQFVGSSKQPATGANWNKVEAHISYTVNDVLNNLKNNKPVAKYQPNVVLLLAGSQDVDKPGTVWTDPDLNRTRQEMEEVVDQVFTQCENCVTLLAQIPPIGSTQGQFEWPPSAIQHRAIRYNAMIAEIVNKKRRLNNYHLLKVHLSNTVRDHYSDLFPNQAGYDGIAYDWAERLSDAGALGWINPPADGVAVSSTINLVVEPATTTNGTTLWTTVTETPSTSTKVAYPVTTTDGSTFYTTVSASDYSRVVKPTAKPKCWPPDHDYSVSFDRAQAVDAIDESWAYDCLTALQKDGEVGCMLHFSPCQQVSDVKPVDVVMSVEQIQWPKNTTSVDLPFEELVKTIYAIMDDCNTNTQTQKFGGWTIVGSTDWIRRYNLSAHHGDVPSNGPPGFKFSTETAGGTSSDCKTWQSESYGS